MNLNAYRDEVAIFLGQSEQKGPISNSVIVKMLETEFEHLKECLDDSSRFCHQVYDMMFLLFELSATNDFDLDAEWEQGRQKKMKYL